MSTNNINLNELWSGQQAEQPATKDLLLRMNAFKKLSRRKIMLTNLTLTATSIFILFVWIYYQPQFLTTKIGIILIIVAMVIFIFSSTQSLGLWKKVDDAESNQQYLKVLLAIKGKQQFMQTTLLNVYFGLLSMGLALYLYEYTSRMTPFWAVSTYGITGCWILFNWFYLRPKQIKKQQAKLDEIISRYENIQKQLNQV